MPTQKNSASWDLQLGFNLAFKRLNSNIWKLYFVVLKGVYCEMSYLVWFTEVLTGFIEDRLEGIISPLTVYCTICCYTEKIGLGGNTSGMYSGDGLNLGQDIG